MPLLSCGGPTGRTMLAPRAQSRLEAFTPCERNHLMASSLSTVPLGPIVLTHSCTRRIFAPLPWRSALAIRGAGAGDGQPKSGLGHGRQNLRWEKESVYSSIADIRADITSRH